MEGFKAEDCKLFERVRSGTSWSDVAQNDQEQIKRIRGNLKIIAENCNSASNGDVPLKSFVSHPTPNGRSPRELWTCLLPESVSNKSFSFQIALIISSRGGEICFCLGSETHQSADLDQIQRFKKGLARAKHRLADLDEKHVDIFRELLKKGWKMRGAWLKDDQANDFDSLSDWLGHVTGEAGASAAFSRYLSPGELDTLGEDIFEVFLEAVNSFRPIFDEIYMEGFKPLAIRPDYERTEQIRRGVDISVLSKPFAILTGASGTGKTKLAIDLARYLAEGDEVLPDRNWVCVPVGADWTDNRSVVGFVNHLRGDEPVYQTTPVLELILRAIEKREVPHFLILDEMNLSHVERYFSDFLSAMESKESIPLHEEGESIPKAGGEGTVPREIAFPENLFVIGTVNIDETTYMFSPKVLDRANVIEFAVESEEMEAFLNEPHEYPEMARAEEGVAQGFLELAKKARLDADKGGLEPLPEGVKREINGHLMALFEILRTGRYEYGYRTANEVMRYLRVCRYFAEQEGKAEEWDGEGWKGDLDAQVVQKLLPKLHGSVGRIGNLLQELAGYCSSGERGRFASLKDVVEEVGAGTFPNSFKKLRTMAATLRAEQFVSFIQ